MPPLSAATQRLWNEVRNSRCQQCPLGERANTVCMCGDGLVMTAGMIIGESPGYDEDRLGRPFKGKSGAYLDITLADVGLNRDDLYVTNAVKCIPPQVNKETAVKHAVPACKPYLMEEIKRIHPRAILLLGAAALKALTGKEGISTARGHEYYDEELKTWIVVAMHPAWVLRNPHGHDNFYSDLARFGRRVRGEVVPEPVVKMCMTRAEVDTCLAHFEGLDSPFSADFETQGFFDFRPGAKIWMLSLSDDPALGYVIPLEHPESPWVSHESYMQGLWERLKRLLEHHKTVWQNAKFDSRWGYRRNIHPSVWFDTMIAAHLLNENRKVGLEELAVSELGASRWGKGKIKFDPPDPLDKMGPYAGKDAAYTYALYLKFRAPLSANQGLAHLYKHACLPGAEALLRAEIHGIWVDPDRFEERNAETNVKAAELITALYETVPANLREQADLQARRAKHGHPFASPVFVSDWLFSDKGLGVTATKFTPKKGDPQVTAEALQAIAGQHPAVDLLLQLHQQEKRQGFFTQWAWHIGPDGRLHPFNNLVGTNTGRRSCANPNLQQTPREVYMRSIFGAPDGKVLAAADYSQVELRIAAYLSGDPVMLLAFSLGRDIHALTASMATGKFDKLLEERGLVGKGIEELLYNTELFDAVNASVTNDERRMAKAINFGFLFGMGARGFQMYALENYGLTVTLDEATAFRALFFELYSALPAWHARQKARVAHYHEVPNPAGRMRRLLTILSSDQDMASYAERQSINAPVQGFGGDLTLTSEGIFVDELDWSECAIVGDIHDELLFEVDADKVDKWLPVIKKVMEYPRLREYFGLEFTVPLVVEIKVGQHWGEGTEWKEQVAA
jgi:DNA polymerase-1